MRLSSGVLVGREQQLSASLTALDRLEDGRPGIVIVTGPAGIGKTRFVEALTDQLRAHGATTVAGSCPGLGSAVPYAAFIAAFRGVHPPPLHLLDVLTAAVDVSRSRLFAMLCDEMAAMALRRRTILVVEDLQWSDRVTRDALLYLIATARSGRWALVVTVRDDQAVMRPAIRQFLGLLYREAPVRISLEPLPPRDVAGLVEGITGVRPSRHRAEALHRRTGGIPLLVEEVVAAETAGGAPLADHLRDLFIARVRQLGRHAERAVEVVALVGNPCSDQLVARVLRVDRAEASAALAWAVRSGVLTEDAGRYRMRHELLREAVYDALPAPRRRLLHRRVAQSLDAGGAAPAVLAHHWDAAGEAVQAAEARLAAAALAERMHAPAEAHSHLERALAHVDALPAEQAALAGDRGALLARSAEAAYLAGEFDRAVQLAELSLGEAGTATLEALRWERLARYRWVARDGAGAQRAHLRSISSLSHETPAAARARVLSGHGWNLAITGRTDEARVVSQEALEAAEGTDSQAERCRALLAWGYAREDQEAGLAALQRARDLAVACDLSDELARAQLAVALSLTTLGRRAEREQALRDGLGHVAAHGLAGSYAPVMRYLLVELLLETGRWQEAAEHLGESIERGVSGLPEMFTYAYLAQLAAGRGDGAVLESAASRVEELSRDMPQQPIPGAVVLCARAEGALWGGDPNTALRYATRADHPDGLGQMVALVLQARAVADLADLARRHGRAPPPMPPAVEAEAEAWSSREHPRMRAMAATMAAERSRRRGDRAAAPWREAVVCWEAAADPYGAAYSRLRLAHALLGHRTGRREAAMHLQEGLNAASQLGAAPLADAVTGLATAARLSVEPPGAGHAERARGSPPESPESLTPREREILPLLAAGRTNSEIADVLVISPRTVGVHVARILRKLGASRRTEAVYIAHRRGLLDQ